MLEDNIAKLLENGNKIEAIKLLKNQKGMSLKEAKEYVDKYACEPNIDEQKTYKRKVKWEGSFGYIGAFLVLILIIVAVMVYFKGK